MYILLSTYITRILISFDNLRVYDVYIKSEIQSVLYMLFFGVDFIRTIKKKKKKKKKKK